jgi:DNA-binding NarL/FixJ family response regulator
MRNGNRGKCGDEIRLLIVEDEDMFAELVAALVASDDRIELVGRARNGQEGVALARASAPDVIVMDIGMPVLDGIEATRRIRTANPSVGVVIFTGSDEPRDIDRARDVGAAAFVQKSHIDAVLLAAIHRAAEATEERSREPAGERKLETSIALA